MASLTAEGDELVVRLQPWEQLAALRREVSGERPDFNAVLRPGPAVAVELDPPARFARVLVSDGDAEAAVSRLSGPR